MIDNENLNLIEETVFINRIVKVTKGGRRFRIAALVAVGDGNGKVGLGYGKSKEVPDAISKATNSAKKNMVEVFIKRKENNKTLPYEVWGVFGSTKVLLKPARPGTGIIAGGIVRSVVSKAGITDILSKVYGNKNPMNVAKATMIALSSIENPSEIAKKRGKSLNEIFQ
jgi:small subunit ribosomal protein S5